MNARDFASLIHEYCTTKQIVNGGDRYGELTEWQSSVITEIKRLLRK